MPFDSDSPIGTKLELNLTAFIDILFILLLFFILSTTFNQSAIPIQLPHSTTATHAPKHFKNIEIELTSNGKTWYKTKHVSDATLIQLFRTKPNQLVLRADRKCPTQYLIQTMDLARSMGIFNIIITTSEK